MFALQKWGQHDIFLQDSIVHYVCKLNKNAKIVNKHKYTVESQNSLNNRLISSYPARAARAG